MELFLWIVVCLGVLVFGLGGILYLAYLDFMDGDGDDE
jgi:hypothetical protein